MTHLYSTAFYWCREPQVHVHWTARAVQPEHLFSHWPWTPSHPQVSKSVLFFWATVLLLNFAAKWQRCDALFIPAARNSRPIFPLGDCTHKWNRIWIEFIKKHQVSSHLRKIFLASRKIHASVNWAKGVFSSWKEFLDLSDKICHHSWFGLAGGFVVS